MLLCSVVIVSKCHYAECQNANCHYDKCQKCRKSLSWMSFCSAKCHFTQGQYSEFHSSDYDLQCWVSLGWVSLIIVSPCRVSWRHCVIFDSVLTEEKNKGQGLCIFTAPIKWQKMHLGITTVGTATFSKMTLSIMTHGVTKTR